MPLISSSIPNLINGISQQPDALRLASQAETQENFYSSVVEGLKKRAPTEHVAKLMLGQIGSVHIHTINRDANERYLVFVTNGNLIVYNIAGVLQTVVYDNRVITLQNAAVANGDGVEPGALFQPATSTTITLVSSGTFVGDVVWEKSTTGAFGGEETTVRTDTDTAVSGTVAWTSGEYIRARIANWVSGAITAKVTWASSNYLTTPVARSDFRSITVADFTFLVNKSKTIKMGANLSSANASEALVFVKQIASAIDYSINIDGNLRAAYSSPDTGTVSTVTAAEDLRADLVTNLGAGWTISREHSTVRIIKDDGSDFEVKAIDSRSGTYLKAFKDTVQKFTDLPTIAPAGFIVEVVGDNNSNFDNYYVKFETNNSAATFDVGIWRETVAPGILDTIDSGTMPHVLIRQADATFTFGPQVWGLRGVGDVDSAPDPSFVTRQINDVFFFKNRLGFLSDENVICSRSGEFFDFFPETVTTLLDSDPIDVAASHNKVSILNFAIPFNEQLLLFADQTQFVFKGGDLLTPKTASIILTTEFDANVEAPPVGAGRTVYFSFAKDAFTGVREYFVEEDTLINDAAEVTAHVQKYIEGNVFKMAAATAEDILVCLPAENTKRLYVYKFYWNGNEKLQSSWSRFTFNDTALLNVDFIDTDMFLVFQRADAVYLEKMNVAPGRLDPLSTILTHLDRRVDDTQLSVSYDEATDRTTWFLPYVVNTAATYQVATRADAGEVKLVLESDTGDGTGEIRTEDNDFYLVVQESPLNFVVGRLFQDVQHPTTTSISVNGKQDLFPVYIGEKYTARYRFSTQFVKADAPGGGRAVVGEGRLQMLNWSVLYDNTGFFRMEVLHDHRPIKSIYEYSGHDIGAQNAIIGVPALGSGAFKVPVHARNTNVKIDIVNDSILPCHLTSAEWEARFTLRSSRLTVN